MVIRAWLFIVRICERLFSAWVSQRSLKGMDISRAWAREGKLARLRSQGQSTIQKNMLSWLHPLFKPSTFFNLAFGISISTL